MIHWNITKKENFYMGLTKIWFALVLFNIALNLVPLLEQSSKESAQISQNANDICESQVVRSQSSNGGGPCGFTQLSCAAAGTSTASSDELHQASLPQARNLGLPTVIALFLPSGEIITKTDVSTECDRGPPLT